MTGKTTTIVIHHDRCKPADWGLDDWMALDRFVRTGNLHAAAALARRGMQFIASEQHTPLGGTLEHLGYAAPKGETFSDDLSDVVDFDDDVEEVVPIYRGPSVYAMRLAVGDGDDIIGHEIEIKPTRQAAEDYLEGLRSESGGDGT